LASSVPPEITLLPVPAAHNFRYVRPLGAPSPARPKVVARNPPAPVAARGKPRQVDTIGSLFGLTPFSRHQLSVARPPGGATVIPR
jgi:hypothetical protein